MGFARFTAVLVLALASPALAASLSVEAKKVSVNGKAFSVRVVRAPLDSYRVKVGLARGRVGHTESLAAIAKRCGAVAAINGCFFDAYVSSPTKLPWHNLITGGEVAHIGDTGTTLGFDENGDYRMERVRIRVRGRVGTNSWYAYLVNHPGNAVLYNRYWNAAKTPAQGTQVVVSGGTVQRVTTGGQPICADGCVLSFGGGESGMVRRFSTGSECTREVAFEGASDPGFWSRVTEAIGCGPMLVSDGEMCCDPPSEGFSSYKILSMSGARSAVGVTPDRTLLLVTCSCTVQQLAGVMKALGARDAMNLDGGASCGLYANGKCLVSPGRLISNAVVVVKR